MFLRFSEKIISKKSLLRQDRFFEVRLDNKNIFLKDEIVKIK